MTISIGHNLDTLCPVDKGENAKNTLKLSGIKQVVSDQKKKQKSIKDFLQKL